MKYLILLSCFVTLFAYKASSQTTSSSADTIVWGSVKTNFSGGQEGYNKYVTDSAKYPNEAFENRVNGCTYLMFIIEKDGSISNVKVFRGIGSPMDVIAWNLIRNSGKWIPDIINGSPVRTKCKAAVNFILKENTANGTHGIVTGEPKNPVFLRSE